MNTQTFSKYSVVAVVSSIFFFCTIASTSFASTISKTNGAIILKSEQSGQPDLKTVNGRIVVGDGLEVGNVKTTNGSISLGEETVAKNVRTTNGGISIDSGSRIDDVRTTNGGISVRGTQVDGDIRTSNGGVKVFDGSEVKNVITANGGIKLDHAKVSNDVKTRNGSVTLVDAMVRGDLVIEDRNGRNGWSLFNWGKHKIPKVVIGPNSEIKGSLIALQDIELHIHESAKVGDIEGAEPEYYSSNKP